jgi:hypothetical protein
MIRITCFVASSLLLTGKTPITIEDGTFAQPGRVGVWTEADAASSFDDIEVNVRQ